MKALVLATLGVALAAAGAWWTRAWWGLALVERVVDARFPDTPTIRAHEAATAHTITFVDVRGAQEYRVSHIPGAHHLPPDASDQQITTLLATLPPQQRVVAYCAVGMRSGRMTDRLRALGHPDAANLRGGLFRWAHQERPLVDHAGDPTGRVHPYDQVWGHLLPGTALP